MREDQPRVGEDLKQRGQVEHMLRRLEDPRAQRAFLLGPADQPQQVGHMAIGGHGAFLFAPAREGGHAPLRLELHAIEAGGDEAEFLFRLVGPGRVDRQRARIGEARDLQDALCQHGAEILALAFQHLFEIGARHRADRLETAQIGKALVGREQAMKPRGARAHRPHDHHRIADRAGEYLRVTVEPHLRVKAIAQQVMELLHGGKIARGVEARFLLRRLQQDVQSLDEPAIPEVVEAISAGDFLHQDIAVEAGLVDHADLAPQPDPGVDHIDETAAARRRKCLVWQVSWPLWLLSTGAQAP